MYFQNIQLMVIECIVGLKSLNNLNDLNDAWILGDVYLKTVGCVQFDVRNKQMTISPQTFIISYDFYLTDHNHHFHFIS